MTDGKKAGLAPLLRTLMLEDADAIETAQRMMVLIMTGPLSGFPLREDERALGVAEMARRVAVEHGHLSADTPPPRPMIFGYPDTDLICGSFRAGPMIMFCHSEEAQRGFVLVTDLEAAHRYPLAVPLYTPETSDVPGVETLH